jgi:hypothetical protein
LRANLKAIRPRFREAFRAAKQRRNGDAGHPPTKTENAAREDAGEFKAAVFGGEKGRVVEGHGGLRRETMALPESLPGTSELTKCQPEIARSSVAVR